MSTTVGDFTDWVRVGVVWSTVDVRVGVARSVGIAFMGVA